MRGEIRELDVVALRCAVPEAGLVEGQVGTVVEVFDDDGCEVEFSGDDGRAYAMLALRSEQLMVLHYSRAEAA